VEVLEQQRLRHEIVSDYLWAKIALLTGYDLAALDPLGDEYVHLITECTKPAIADRDAFYGDPQLSAARPRPVH
jgi:gamma-glutamyltranspeptidase